MYQLRDYQTHLVGRTRDAFRQHKNVLIVSATGSGKTVMFAYITEGAAAKGNRVMICAHRTEITGQISAALESMGVRHGRIQPGHSQTDDAVQVAMVQTLARRSARVAPPDLLVVDEAHHCAADSYQSLMKLWPDAKILGVTATPRRLDGRGLGRTFTTMVEGPSPADLIRDGWLAGYRYLAPPSKVDLSKIHKRAGDYAIDELAEAVDKAVITGDAVRHYADYLAPRPAIVFTVRVDHAEHVAAQFAAAGFNAASVDGTMDRATRRDRIEGIGNGQYQILTSCALISEGLDVPSVGGVILLRPTASLAMHLQQIGRSLRPKPDGSQALILDHVGNVHRHGLPDAPHTWTLDDKPPKETTPTSQCEVCYRVFHTAPPGWRAAMRAAIEAETEGPCEAPDDPDCLLATPEAAAPAALPEVVEGKLEEWSSTPSWTQGCDIIRAHGPEWHALLSRATTRERLEQIRVARGYHWKWTDRILQSRRGAA